MKILITGGNGYLARNIVHGLSDYEVTTVTRSDFDLADKIATTAWFTDKQFDVVLHTAIKGGSRLRPDGIMDSWNNMKMFNNLIDNKEHFNRLINFGSGAEYGESAYGTSKHVIHQHVKEIDNFYTLRIYAVFNEDELDTRFIKNNLLRYLAREPMIVYQNKFMDFFYMGDLIKVVRYYIETENPPKEFNCVYGERLTLYRITAIINALPNYKVNVIIEKPGFDSEYTGKATDLGIEYIGLKDGIRQTYNALIQ